MGRHITIKMLATAAVVSTAATALIAARHRITRAQLAAARFELAHDELTGAFNRAGFVEQAHLVAAGSRAMTAPVLGILDANRFKAINDRYGHDGGNAVLTTATALLAHLLGRSESVVARLHGDELAILAPAARVTRILAGGLSVRCRFKGQQIQCSFSLGTTRFDPDANFADLMRQADLALYAAKAAGGGHAAYEHYMADTMVTRGERPAIKNLELLRQTAVLEPAGVIA